MSEKRLLANLPNEFEYPAAIPISFYPGQAMANIPPEIWFHIARFIAEEDLPDLLRVNSIFFNIAMNIRYREIEINPDTITYRGMKTLKRLRDPFVAARVYRLKLRLTDVKIVLHPSVNTLNSRLGHQPKHAIARIFGGSKSLWLRPINVTLTGLINEIIKITKKLVNVRELYIALSYLPLSSNLRPLFSSLWSSFGPKLHTLSLKGVLEDFRTLIKDPMLDGLQELHAEFSLSHVHGINADRAIFVDVLLPFINSLAPHLLSLRLWSWSSLDLSTFFAQLASFPVLKTLVIATPLNKDFGYVSCLKGLICDSFGTLQGVDLCLNSNGSTVVPLSKGPLSRWVSECLSDERFFSQLKDVDVYPPELADGIEFLLDCIQRTCQTFVELIVRDQILQDRGIDAVIHVVSSCKHLTYLKMKIQKRDTALTNHSALKLPKIDRLQLSIREYSIDKRIYLINIFVQDPDIQPYLYQLEIVGRDMEIWFGGGY